ncbi:unnamed protein product (macronuclear) [Paramecium tetraurelia]|uniref:Uncharacterized protein n=1 Tax=Paramecium tetraurelia TaxID=5888 RepID=A0BVC7_PARTE|nr:uncharacterized protein GSPATT00005740001 [Paramecium tetraurelia]CAK62494.1 unnamed protein product [Paramecium tetraurelia]|eukprot:XP_001429892.1 hypothetical protein (macronuclear) [Paramecium tetraurelia strain d4-2]
MYQQSITQAFQRQPNLVQTQYIGQQQIPRVQQQRSITPVLHKPNAYTVSFTQRDDFSQRGQQLPKNMISDDSQFMKALIEENQLLKQQVMSKRAELQKIIEYYHQCS